MLPPSQFTLGNRYCRDPGIISDPTLIPRSKRSLLFSCDLISNLASHILIWREQFPDVRSEVYRDTANSSGKILVGVDIMLPSAIVGVLQPALCSQQAALCQHAAEITMKHQPWD